MFACPVTHTSLVSSNNFPLIFENKKTRAIILFLKKGLKIPKVYSEISNVYINIEIQINAKMVRHIAINIILIHVFVSVYRYKYKSRATS